MVSCSRNFSANSRLKRKRGLVVDAIVAFVEAHGEAQFFFGQPVHSHEQAAAFAFLAAPGFDLRCDCLPAAKVKVADAEVGVIGEFEGFL